MRIPVSIRTRYYEANNQKALVDSGATDCFIHPRLAEQMKVGAQAFEKPKKIFNIDNTENKSGSITHFIDLKVQTKGIVKDMCFLILCKKKSQVKSEKTAFSQQKSTKSQGKVKKY